VFRVAAEFQNIPLRDTKVLQQLPRRVRRAFGLLAPEPRRKIGESGLKTNMSMLTAKQFQHMSAQSVIFFHQTQNNT
jgi:hypothetical protein